MDAIEILPATEEEREWAAQLMASSDPWITLGRGLESCRASCSSQADTMLFVAHIGSRPCGFILLRRRGLAGSPYVASIAVAPGSRSAGIGGRLLMYAEDLFRDGANHIFLCVSSFNRRARALYEKHGYAAVGELKDYIIEGNHHTLPTFATFPLRWRLHASTTLFRVKCSPFFVMRIAMAASGSFSYCPMAAGH